MSDQPQATAAPLALLQQRLGVRFNDPTLLERALTHRSFSAQHNERLEFLGDSVLNLAVAGLLYERLAEFAEGDLSRVRASMVRQETLHAIALDLDLSPLLRLGAGEVQSGGRLRPSILADALEAVLGALYLDAGHAAADALVRRLFGRLRIDARLAADAKDAKTALQEWLQGRRMKLPLYQVVGTQGAAHQQQFEVACEVAEGPWVERGRGASRRAAEQTAAQAMLARLQQQAPPAA